MSGSQGPASSVTPWTATARVAPSRSAAANPSASSVSASRRGMSGRWPDTSAAGVLSHGPPRSSPGTAPCARWRPLLRADAPELLAHGLRPAPHLDDLRAPGARVADPELALDPRVVEEL